MTTTPTPTPEVLAAKKRRKAVQSPPKNYIAYFTLCQTIGGRLEELEAT